MKRFFLTKIIFLFIFFAGILHAESDAVCGTVSSGQVDLSQEGGIYLTASGELKVLVVFAKFLNDDNTRTLIKYCSKFS